MTCCRTDFESINLTAKLPDLLNIITHFLLRRDNPVISMNKLVIVTVLIVVLAFGVESFRVPRDTEEEEEPGPVTLLIGKLRNYYDYSLNVAGSYVETIKDLKLDEKAKNLYDETTGAVRTYAGIVQDQLYHMIYSSESS
ncbi:hypothetical protein AMELA_G00083590 [Ameiurus melas]|uniref:Apolipoprotein C-II n=1 Tax=Ameiurus melas TaxID=219545 RepID=A0A7J6B228_AMEME|nr:hypothetical protein AMELA_G00083590 [Ameiurus melas]